MNSQRRTIRPLRAFYAATPFWVQDQISISGQTIPEDLSDLMAECMYSHSTDDYKLSVCRDGMFIIEVSSLENDLKKSSSSPQFSELEGRYLEYINCVILLLESALQKVSGDNWIFSEEINKKNVIHVFFEDNHFKIMSHPSYGTAELFTGSRILKTISPYDGSESWLKGREVLGQDVFNELFQDADIVFKSDENVKLLARLMKSLSEYRMADKEISLLISWFVLESFINQKWDIWLEEQNKESLEGSKRINSKRREELTKGRDYTASVISNFLELANVLSFDEFKHLTVLRKVRNSIVHKKKEDCTYEHCRDALKLATKWVNAELAITLLLDLSHPIY